jgi:DHA2 family multidrug resistance protein
VRGDLARLPGRGGRNTDRAARCIRSLAGLTADRLTAHCNAVGTHTADLAIATARATNLLAAAIARRAAVLSFIGGFLAAAAGAFLCLALAASLQRPAPQAGA